MVSIFSWYFLFEDLRANLYFLNQLQILCLKPF